MAKYRKKPVVIEAFKWTGDRTQIEDPEWIVDAIKMGRAEIYEYDDHKLYMDIKTFDGAYTARAGDYIIRGIKGEIYPCKPDIFEMTYESVEDND